MSASGDAAIDRRKLWWAGPATVAAAVVVVRLLQVIEVAVMHPAQRSLLRTEEPAIFTAILVTIAVLVFVAVSAEAMRPVATFRRIAFVALIVSCLPDLAIGFGVIGDGWPLAVAFILMHVAAWAVTVSLLPRLTAA